MAEYTLPFSANEIEEKLGQVDTLTSKTSSLESENASLKSRTTSLENENTSLKSRATSLESRATTLETKTSGALHMTSVYFSGLNVSIAAHNSAMIYQWTSIANRVPSNAYLTGALLYYSNGGCFYASDLQVRASDKTLTCRLVNSSASAKTLTEFGVMVFYYLT